MDFNARGIPTSTRHGATSATAGQAAEGMALLRTLQGLDLDQRRWVLDHMPREDRQVLEQWLRQRGQTASQAPPQARWDLAALQAALQALGQQKPRRNDQLALSHSAESILSENAVYKPQSNRSGLSFRYPMWQRWLRAPSPQIPVSAESAEKRLSVALARAVLETSRVHPLSIPVTPGTSGEDIARLGLASLYQESKRIAGSWSFHPEVIALAREAGRDVGDVLTAAVELHRRQLEQWPDVLSSKLDDGPLSRQKPLLLSLPFGFLLIDPEHYRARYRLWYFGLFAVLLMLWAVVWLL